MSDTQMVLPIDKVVYYAQEVCVVIATDRYIAADALEAITVDYEPLPPVVDPFKALEDEAIVRDDKEEKTNHIWHWEAGNAGCHRPGVRGCRGASVKQDMYIPRIHVASIETCGMVANYDKVTGTLTHLHDLAGAARPPHGVRAGQRHCRSRRSRSSRPTSAAASAARCRSIPAMCVRRRQPRHRQAGQVDRGPQREPAGRLASPATTTSPPSSPPTRDGKITGLRVQDHRRLRRRPTPPPTRRSSRPACTASAPARTTSQAAHVAVDGVYTNKPPGGVAYRCSFRVTEAVHLIERMTDIMAHELGETRPSSACRTSSRPNSSPTSRRPAGSTTAATTTGRCARRWTMIDYAALRREQLEKRANAAS